MGEHEEMEISTQERGSNGIEPCLVQGDGPDIPGCLHNDEHHPQPVIDDLFMDVRVESAGKPEHFGYRGHGDIPLTYGKTKIILSFVQ